MANNQLDLAFNSSEPAETLSLGERLGKAAAPGDVILLIGNLGAGKTCFTQGIAKGLEITQQVQSPTFVLAREMLGRLPLYHLDLYRLEDITEVSDLGIDDYLYGSGVTVIEWADKGLELMPDDNLTVHFETTGENSRRLRFCANGKRYVELLKEMREPKC